MMNKLIRPMTIEDEQGASITIDALDVTDFDVLNCMLTIDHKYQEHLHFPSKSTSEIFRMFNAKLYEAINAPVLATEEVLAGLPKDANFLVNVKNDSYMGCWVQAVFQDYGGHYDRKNAMKWIRNQEWVIEYAEFADECGDRDYILEVSLKELLIEGDPVYIKSNECSKTAEYLRQFYTDGTPVKEGRKHE